MTKTKRRDDGRKYDIGDLVTLFGDESTVYRVDDFAKVSESDGSEYFQYAVYTCGGGEMWLDVVYEEDMTLLARAEDAETFLRMRRSLQTANQPLTVDELLDDLNSLIKMRNSFEDGETMRAMVDEMISDTKKHLRKKIVS